MLCNVRYLLDRNMVKCCIDINVYSGSLHPTFSCSASVGYTHRTTVMESAKQTATVGNSQTDNKNKDLEMTNNKVEETIRLEMEINSMNLDSNKGEESTGGDQTVENGDTAREAGTNEEDKLTVCRFYQEGRCRFGETCRNLHEGPVNHQVKKTGEKKKKISDPDAGGGPTIGKKKPMKTALDVIKRIQWDPDFTKEFFTVGYLDRFEGVLEAPFTTFTWEDLSSLDWDTLAIPQHRIQYFKYKTDKVWDKNEKLDVVFGSTGHPVGILQFMEEVDRKLLEKRFEAGSEDEDDSSSSDSEDEMEISVGAVKCSTSIPDEDRSTHFLAVRVTDPEVIANLLTVQKNIVDQEEILRDCCMKEGLFHITLGMFRIMDIEGIQAAVDLVDNLTTDSSEVMQGRDTSLIIRNLNNFGHRVVYAEVHPRDPQFFQDFVSFIKAKFDLLGEKVKSTNSFEFIPHLTLAKVSRPISRIRRSQYISQSYYAEHAANQFGEQRLDNLQLCIIESSTRFDGFYTTLTDVKL